MERDLGGLIRRPTDDGDRIVGVVGDIDLIRRRIHRHGVGKRTHLHAADLVRSAVDHAGRTVAGIRYVNQVCQRIYGQRDRAHSHPDGRGLVIGICIDDSDRVVSVVGHIDLVT